MGCAAHRSRLPPLPRLGGVNFQTETLPPREIGKPSDTAARLALSPWIGLAPTGKPVTMRVMDFWRCEGSLLAENWVMIDIPHLLLQMGVDVFARMAALLPPERTK